MKTTLAQWFINLKWCYKASLLISIDVLLSQFALWAAFSMRLSQLYLPVGHDWYFFAVSPIIVVPIFIRFGLYRAIIRYIEIRALWTIIQATLLYSLIFAFILYVTGFRDIPRTVSILNGLNMLVFVAGSRFFARWWLSDLRGITRTDKFQNKKNVVIYGAGNSGVQLASGLAYGREFKPVAFIDDNKFLHKQKINGIRIYAFSALADLVTKYQVSDVLLAMPSLSRNRRREIIQLLEPYALHIMSMPRLSDIAQGKVNFNVLQEVDIADLLGRDSVAPDPSLLSATIADKVVMVTGAGGSIGSELARQIVLLRPTVLILFELSEFALYSIEKEILALQTKLAFAEFVEIVPLLGSVAHFERLKQICKIFKVQTIYHAAAYKHVPMVEKNACQAVYNNVFGTLAAARAAVETGVETFVLISTDKAVRPTNIMGATKRFAELILQAFSLEAGKTHHTRFTMVRFGNVLGSSGSVVPLFKEQIAQGGPVTITDTRVIRYFMTIPEASQLVIQAGAMGQGGDVFVLDMGDPVSILDLARRMIHLSGLEVKDAEHPDGEIEINTIGLRPGEKLYEELLIGNNVSETSHPKIMRAEEQIIPRQQLDEILVKLEEAINNQDLLLLRKLLQDTVTGYVPAEFIGDLLWQYAHKEADEKKPPTTVVAGG